MLFHPRVRKPGKLVCNLHVTSVFGKINFWKSDKNMEILNERRINATNAEIDVKLIEKYSSNKSTQTILLFAKNVNEEKPRDYSSILSSYQEKLPEKVKALNK